MNISYFFHWGPTMLQKQISIHLEQNRKPDGRLCDLIESASKLVLDFVLSVWEEKEGNPVTECYSLSPCNKQIYEKYES